MGGDREECLGVDTLFGGCGVDDVDVGALTGAATGVGRDGDQSVGMDCVPYALSVGILAGGRANLMAVE